MRATVRVKEEFKRKWIIPLIIFVFAILFEYFLGKLLLFHSYNSIISLQDFMSKNIGLSNFNNTIIKMNQKQKKKKKQVQLYFLNLFNISTQIFFI